MGRTYGVPRSAKGESRILYIFTVRSLLATLVGAGVGVIPYLIFSSLGMTVVGIIIIAVFGLLGYGIMTLTIPDVPLMGKLRKAGGEKVSDILLRTLTFSKRKKIYLYRKGGKKEWKAK